jgi:two-component system, LytTR family, response regulator
MEKMKIMIADDDAYSRNLLIQLIQKLPEYEVVGEAANGEELILLFTMAKPDIVLVDINMPYVNGVEAARACKEITPYLQVIFTTGSDEYAVEAFNIAATDYIVKPVEKIRLFIALEKAKRAIQLHKSYIQLPDKKTPTKLSIKANNTILYIPLMDILYLEKKGRKTMIHTANQIYETKDTLQDLQARLPDYFYKTHRSYLVNIHKIYKIVPSGETYLTHFSCSEKNAHISRLKINEVYDVIGEITS